MPPAVFDSASTRTEKGSPVPGLVVVAMYLKRVLIVVPPLSRPVIAGDIGSYLPSPVEIAIVSGAAAGVALIMLFLFRFLPVLAIDEMAEIEHERTEAAGVGAASARPALGTGTVGDG